MIIRRLVMHKKLIYIFVSLMFSMLFTTPSVVYASNTSTRLAQGLMKDENIITSNIIKWAIGRPRTTLPITGARVRWLMWPTLTAWMAHRLELTKPHKTILPLFVGSGFSKRNVSMATNVVIGDKKIPMIFDTGCAAAMKLSLAALQKSGIKYIKTKDFGKGVSPLGVHKTPIVILPEIKLGKFTIYNVRAEIFKKQWAGEKYWNYKNFKDVALKNGVIGLPIIKHFNVLVDFENNQVVLYKQRTNAKINFAGWTKIPFETKYGFIGANGYVDGELMRLVWDTAFIPSQIKPLKSLQNNVKPCPTTYSLMANNLRCLYPQKIFVSGKRIPNTIFLFKDLGLPKFVPIDGFVGTNFYFQNKVFFDFKNHVMCIKSYKSEA